MTYPSMELHGSSWRAKKRTPHDLQKYYPGKLWHRYNTGVSDKKGAATLIHRWVADLAEEWQRLRETGNPRKQAIKPEEVAHIVRLMVRSSLAADEEARDEGDYATEEGYSSALRRLDSLESSTRDAISRRVFSDEGMLVEDWLGVRLHGFLVLPQGCLQLTRVRAFVGCHGPLVERGNDALQVR